MESVMAEVKPERRRWPRSRTLKAGRIVFNLKSSVVTCMVRNLTDHGALLVVESTAGIPQHFELLMEHELRGRPCMVVWQQEKQIGVTFG